MRSCCVALRTISRHLWWSMVMWEKRIYTCMCNWVTMLYSSKLAEHCKPGIMRKKIKKFLKNNNLEFCIDSVSCRIVGFPFHLERKLIQMKKLIFRKCQREHAPLASRYFREWKNEQLSSWVVAFKILT